MSTSHNGILKPCLHTPDRDLQTHGGYAPSPCNRPIDLQENNYQILKSQII